MGRLVVCPFPQFTMFESLEMEVSLEKEIGSPPEHISYRIHARAKCPCIGHHMALWEQYVLYSGLSLSETKTGHFYI